MNRKELLLLAIGIFLTVITSLAIDIYNIRNKNQLGELGQPLRLREYKIDNQLLKILENKTE